MVDVLRKDTDDTMQSMTAMLTLAFFLDTPEQWDKFLTPVKREVINCSDDETWGEASLLKLIKDAGFEKIFGSAEVAEKESAVLCLCDIFFIVLELFIYLGVKTRRCGRLCQKTAVVESLGDMCWTLKK